MTTTATHLKEDTTVERVLIYRKNKQSVLLLPAPDRICCACALTVWGQALGYPSSQVYTALTGCRILHGKIQKSYQSEQLMSPFRCFFAWEPWRARKWVSPSTVDVDAFS